MNITIAKTRTTPPVSRVDVQKIFFVLATVFGFIWSWNYLDMSVLSFFDDLSNVVNLFKRMYPPDFGDMHRIVNAMLETLWMALLGTFLAAILSYPLALGAARNTSPHPYVRFCCRSIITLTRAVPELILAAIFVAAFDPGPFAGVLAIGLHSIGMIGRLFADAIELADETPREAIAATGSTQRQTTRSAIIPQSLPSMIATVLYRLEINIRGSSVLGLIGAGGIGIIVSESLETIQYKPALAAVSVLFVVILCVELASSAIRASLLGDAANFGRQTRVGFFTRRSIVRNQRLNEKAARVRAVTPPWTSERLFRVGLGALFGALLIVSIVSVDINWWQAILDIPQINIVLKQLFPPSFGGEGSGIFRGLLESFAMAVVATVLGIMLALPIGVAIARNINRSAFLAKMYRTLVLALRAIPELIVAVIFVSAMGLGPVPGTLALTVTVIFFAAKFFGDTLEEVNPSPREAVSSVGASRVQEFASTVIPQFVPAFISNAFYLLDVYFRSSTILGIVGGGGIGYLLIQSIRVFQFNVTCAIVIAVFVIVLIIEWVGNWVRGLYR